MGTELTFRAFLNFTPTGDDSKDHAPAALPSGKDLRVPFGQEGSNLRSANRLSPPYHWTVFQYSWINANQTTQFVLARFRLDGTEKYIRTKDVSVIHGKWKSTKIRKHEL
jgi:hypothetical protein